MSSSASSPSCSAGVALPQPRSRIAFAAETRAAGVASFDLITPTSALIADLVWPRASNRISVRDFFGMAIPWAWRDDTDRIEERERFARQRLAEGVATAFAEPGMTPPADPAFLGLIMHALEDGLLIQRLIAPDGISDTVIVDAVELLIRAWRALARETATTPPAITLPRS